MSSHRWGADQPIVRSWPWITLDAAVAFVSATITVGESDVTALPGQGPVLVQVAAVVWFACITLRRVGPLACLCVAAVATAAVSVSGYPLTNVSLATAMTLALVIRSRPARAAFALSAVPIALTAFALAANPEGRLTLPLAGVAHLLAVIYGIVARAGMLDRGRREDRRHHQAIDSERARLARELHDAVGHAVTLMLTHAGAARLSLSDRAGPVHESLVQIETAGRVAMMDLDRVLHLLDVPTDPGTDLADRLAAIVAGMPDEFGVTLNHHRARNAPDLPPEVSDAIYRTVQESLTNVVRHSTATKVSVVIEHQPDQIRVDIDDNGSVTGASSDDQTQRRRVGRGVAGMHSRIGELTGTVRAGFAEAGGWHTRVVIPLTATRRGETR